MSPQSSIAQWDSPPAGPLRTGRASRAGEPDRPLRTDRPLRADQARRVADPVAVLVDHLAGADFG